MIAQDAVLRIALVPLWQIGVYEYQDRNLDRVDHYVRLLRARPGYFAGLLYLRPRDGRYELLDGHHRFCAYVLAGRPEAMCVIEVDPNAPAGTPGWERGFGA